MMLRGPNEGFEIVKEEFEIMKREESPYRYPTEISWMVKDKWN